MKTTKISLALIMVLFLAYAGSVSAVNGDKLTARNIANRGVQHHVNVIIDADKALCNVYLVEIRDGRGYQIAPAQRYVVGVTGYDFFERGPVSGARIATLVRAPFGSHYICEHELFTTPAILMGPFLNGKIYRYDLFPKTVENKQ